ncbi:MAG: hypothetical protein IPG75_16935 [Gemmatimonadetes bacterium]|nr:hypothetical protein [Gemmatimonadota bacterium]
MGPRRYHPSRPPCAEEAGSSRRHSQGGGYAETDSTHARHGSALGAVRPGNPDDHPVITATVQALDAQLARAEELATQAEAGRTDATASSRGKARVRAAIHDDLALLQPFAALAADRQPDTLLAFELAPLARGAPPSLPRPTRCWSAPPPTRRC